MKLHDPSGHALEFFYGAEHAHPWGLPSRRPPFVTGAQGPGHVVVSAAEPEPEAHRLHWTSSAQFLGPGIACDIHAGAVDITFFHGGLRHHRGHRRSGSLLSTTSCSRSPMTT